MTVQINDIKREFKEYIVKAMDKTHVEGLGDYYGGYDVIIQNVVLITDCMINKTDALRIMDSNNNEITIPYPEYANIEINALNHWHDKYISNN